MLSTPATRSRFRLPDMSVGDPDGRDPLEAYSWQDLHDMMYRNPGTP